MPRKSRIQFPNLSSTTGKNKGGPDIFHPIELEFPESVYEKIIKLSEGIERTESEVVTLICSRVFGSRYVMGEIGLYFKKNLIIEKTFYMGCDVLQFIPSKVNENLLIDIDVPHHLYESLDAIAYSLDSTISDAIILILEFFLGERKAVYSTVQIGQIKYIN